MAHFRAGIVGSRQEVTRLGHASQGMRAFINGWDQGVKLQASVIGGQDVIEIYATGGSNAKQNDVYIGKVIDGNFIPKER